MPSVPSEKGGRGPHKRGFCNTPLHVLALLGVSLALLVGYFSPADAQICSNGIPGVESTSYDICCSPECTTCGGLGCGFQNTTNGAADCCVTEIQDSGVLCEDTGLAPCIITIAAASNDSTCENNMTGVQDPNTDVCCPLACGYLCGGEGCGTIPGVDASQCCAANITASGISCSDVLEPPCMLSSEVSEDLSNSTCSNGFSGIEDITGTVCCVLDCGQCGGNGCGDIPGLSGADCCATDIEAFGESCDVTGEAPCVLPAPEYTPSMCPNGLEGVQDDTVCCAVECNLQCGGDGCGGIPGTNGASDCCSGVILGSGVYCGGNVTAPCIMTPGTYTDAPTATPTVMTEAPAMTATPTVMTEVPAMTATPTVMASEITVSPTTSDSFAPTPSPSPGSRGVGFSEVPSPAPAPAFEDDDGITSSPTVEPGGTAAPTGVSSGETESPTAASSGSLMASASGLMSIFALLAGAFATNAARRY